MSYTGIFYWLTVADAAKGWFLIFAFFFGVIFAISTVVSVVGDMDDTDTPVADRLKWRVLPYFTVALMLTIFTPSKKDSLLILAGGQTLDFLASDESAKKIPAELSAFVLTELKAMGTEAKIDLGIAITKEEWLSDYKKLTPTEVSQKLVGDEEFKRLWVKYTK